MVKYEMKHGNVLKDGHAMFDQDIVKDLNRGAYLESIKGLNCLLYVDPNKSCIALKERKSEMGEINHEMSNT